jgi:hypothetical protein
MNPLDMERVVLWWGPGVLLMLTFGYGFLRLAHYWIEKSMQVKAQQTDGAYGLVRQYIEKFLGAQSGQADALSRLANSVEHHESQESFEHQEILIALKALHRDMNSLRCRSSEDYCVLRPRAGFAGRCASASDLLQESHSPDCDSADKPPGPAAAAAPGMEPEKEFLEEGGAGTAQAPAAPRTSKPDSNLDTLF